MLLCALESKGREMVGSYNNLQQEEADWTGSSPVAIEQIT